MRGIRAARYALGAVLGAVRGLGGRGSTSGRLQKSKACATTSHYTRRTASTVLPQTFFSLQQNIQTHPTSSLSRGSTLEFVSACFNYAPGFLSLVLHAAHCRDTYLLFFFRPMTVLSLITAAPERETGAVF